MKMLHSNKEPVNEFWDISDLSWYLKIKVKTLYAMVPDIPHYRVGKLIRFRKDEIDAWMESNKSKGIQVRNTPGRRKTHISIDGLIRKVIDQSNDEVYNLSRGKSDLIKGPTKEINNGSI